MKGKGLQFALGLVLAAILVGVVVFDFGAASPGELSTVHYAVAELRGAAGCEACHGNAGRTLAQACNHCHDEIADQLVKKEGLHGTLKRAQALACGRCHVEHRGRHVDPIGNSAFALAGLEGGLEGFQHQTVDYQLTGKHTELDCDKCHENARILVLPKDCNRFLGLSQDCTSCHDDPHDGKLPKCADCHGQERPFAEAALFEHDPRFPLKGSHDNLDCKQCHEPESRYAIEVLSAKGQRGADLALRACVDCHATLHTETFLAGVARTEQVAVDATCTVCHAVEHDDFFATDEATTRRLHEQTGMSLTKPHDALDCRACHEGIGEPIEKAAATQAATAEHQRRFRGRSGSDCAACHESSHAVTFLDAVAGLTELPARGTCVRCHGDGLEDFRTIDETDNRKLHPASGFELDGPHAKLDCAACHEGIGAARAQTEPMLDRERHDRLFPGRDTERCTSCHEDPHKDQFRKGSVAHLDCADCHSGHAFAPPTFDASHHAITRFPLEGSHRSVGCNACHVQKAKDQPVVFADAETRCGACHVDVHDGYFDRPRGGGKAPQKGDCTRCHDAHSFRLRANQTFDHDRHTDFRLVGRHAKARCDQCHTKTVPTHEGTRTFARAESGCSDCHTDPHARQFDVKGVTNCATCHTPTGGFDKLLFDHDKHSRFGLDGQHDSLDCAKCHKSYDLPSGGKVTRYKPLGTTCRDCHGWRSQREYDSRRRKQ